MASPRPILLLIGVLLVLLGTGVVDLDAFMHHEGMTADCADSADCADCNAVAHGHCCSAHHQTLAAEGRVVPPSPLVERISGAAVTSLDIDRCTSVFHPPRA